MDDLLENLSEMKDIDIKNIKTNDLVDIRDVSVEGNLAKPERVREFIRQIKNPYCYKYGDFVIQAEFSSNGVSLEDRLQSIIS